MTIKIGFSMPRATSRRFLCLLVVMATVIILLMNLGLTNVRHAFPQSVTHTGVSCEAEVTAPPIVPVDAVFPVRIEVLRGNVKSIPRSYATIRLNTPYTAAAPSVTLYYGVGTTNLTISVAGVWQLSVTIETRAGHALTETCQTNLSIKAANLSDREVQYKLVRQGTLEDRALLWPAGFVVVEGAVTVPKSKTLVVDPGAVVLLYPEASVKVLGKATIGAAHGLPVLFTAHPNGSGEHKAWGPLWFGQSSLGVLHNTWLTQGGARRDQPWRIGSRNTGAVLSVEGGAEVQYSDGGIVDNAGPGIVGERCTIQVKNTVISRCKDGGSVQQATVTMENVYVTEIRSNHVTSSQPIGDGFVFEQPKQASSTKTFSLISNSVFASGAGVGINTIGSNLHIESTIIEDFSQACVSASGRASVSTIQNSVMRSCLAGLRVKDGKKNVGVTNSVIIGNKFGVWYGDLGDKASNNASLSLRNSLAIANGEANLRVFSGGVDRTNTDMESRNVKLECFFVSRGPTVRTSRSAITFKRSTPCPLPKIHLHHADCDFAVDLLPSQYLWPDNNQDKPADIQLERIDMCRNCCKTVSSLEFGAYDHWRMGNVQNMKGATIYTETSSKEGCGVTFSADLYQYTDSDCIKQRVHVKSAYSNLRHYQGEGHLRELKTHYLDRVMHTDLSARSFGMMMDFSHILDRNSSALIRAALQCSYSKRDPRGVSVFVTSFLPNIAIYTRMTVKLADLAHPNNFHKYVAFLYIGNCMKSRHSDFVDKVTNSYMLIDNDRCLVPDRVGDGDIPAAYRYRLTRLYEILFTKRHVCQVPDDIIHSLKQMNAVSSQVSSLGTKFLEEVKSDPVMAPLVLAEDPEIYAEVDGRVSVLVAQYNALCEDNELDKFDNVLRKVYKTSAITETYLVQGRDYLYAKFADGSVGYLKVVGGEVREDLDGYVLNGGLAELVAYHVDRLLGMGRIPVAAARRLRLDGSVMLNGVVNVQGDVLEDFGGKIMSLGQYLTDVQTTNRDKHWIARHLHHTREELFPFLDVIVVGQVKSLQENVELKPQVREFFKHGTNLFELEKLGVTRQMLRDIADVFVFNFVLHNPTTKDLAVSELRFVSYDNSKAFWPEVSVKVCSSILNCPPVLQPEGIRVSTEKDDACPKICPNPNDFPSDKFVNCRFTKKIFATLKLVNEKGSYKRFLDKLRQSLLKETFDINTLKSYFGPVDLYEGLNARLVHLTRHMKNCLEEFRNGIFI